MTLVVLCAGSAYANGIDPGVIIVGGRGSISLTSSTLNLSYPGQAGCFQGSSLTMVGGQPLPTSDPLYGLPFMNCTVLNATGFSIWALTINITSAQLPLTLQCATLCSSFTQTPTGGTATFFFNPPLATSGFNREFSAIFVNFAPGTTFGLTAVSPEPATLALLGTGLLFIGTRLRKKVRG